MKEIDIYGDPWQATTCPFLYCLEEDLNDFYGRPRLMEATDWVCFTLMNELPL